MKKKIFTVLVLTTILSCAIYATLKKVEIDKHSTEKEMSWKGPGQLPPIEPPHLHNIC